MESIDNKTTQEGFNKATCELLDLELKKSEPNLSKEELNKIIKREKELYILYPMLKN